MSGALSFCGNCSLAVAGITASPNKQSFGTLNIYLCVCVCIWVCLGVCVCNGIYAALNFICLDNFCLPPSTLDWPRWLSLFNANFCSAAGAFSCWFLEFLFFIIYCALFLCFSTSAFAVLHFQFSLFTPVFVCVVVIAGCPQIVRFVFYLLAILFTIRLAFLAFFYFFIHFLATFACFYFSNFIIVFFFSISLFPHCSLHAVLFFLPLFLCWDFIEKHFH